MKTLFAIAAVAGIALAAQPAAAALTNNALTVNSLVANSITLNALTTNLPVSNGTQVQALANDKRESSIGSTELIGVDLPH